jgi:integrase
MSAEPAPVTHLHPITGGTRRGPVLVRDAVEAFLAAPRLAGSVHTRRAYGDVLARLAERLGPDRELADVHELEIGGALTALWGAAAPATWNRDRAAVSSWLGWCSGKARWAAPALPGTCERRAKPREETRAVDRATIDRICTRRDIPLRERVLWRMLYETASRASPCSRSTSRTATSTTAAPASRSRRAHRMDRLGPRHRPAATPLPQRPLCPDTGRGRLGYDRARVLIKQHTGLSLHALRHSAATHLGEAGADATVIMAKGHWRSIRTAARYTRPGLAAVTAANELLGPPHRRA